MKPFPDWRQYSADRPKRSLRLTRLGPCLVRLKHIDLSVIAQKRTVFTENDSTVVSHRRRIRVLYARGFIEFLLRIRCDDTATKSLCEIPTEPRSDSLLRQFKKWGDGFRISEFVPWETQICLMSEFRRLTVGPDSPVRIISGRQTRSTESGWILSSR